MLLVTSALVGFTAWGGIYTVILNLYLLRLGYDSRYIGLLNGIGALTIAIFALLAGLISAKVGARRLLILGMVGMAAGYVLFPLAGYAPHGVRTTLFPITFFIAHVGMTLYIVNASPFLAALTQGKARHQAFAWQTGLMALAGFAGSLIAGMLPGAFAALLGSTLAEPAPYHQTLLLAGVLLLPGIVPLVVTSHAEVDGRASATQRAGKAPLGIIVILSLVGLLTVIGEGTARTFFNVYLDAGLSVPIARIGTISALAQLMTAAASLGTPALVARVGNTRAILLGGLVKALCLLPLVLVAHWLSAAVGLVGLMVFAGVMRPAWTAFHQESVAPHWRATISGATTMAIASGFTIASLGGGYLVPVLGYRGLFLTGAAVSLAGIGVFWLAMVLPSQRADALTSDALGVEAGH
jgi:MFS family permease